MIMSARCASPRPERLIVRVRSGGAVRKSRRDQAERMSRTIKDGTVKTYHYDDLESLEVHLLAFVQMRHAPEGPALVNALPRDLRRLDQKSINLSRSTRTGSFRDHTPSVSAATPIKWMKYIEPKRARIEWMAGTG